MLRHLFLAALHLSKQRVNSGTDSATLIVSVSPARQGQSISVWTGRGVAGHENLSNLSGSSSTRDIADTLTVTLNRVLGLHDDWGPVWCSAVWKSVSFVWFVTANRLAVAAVYGTAMTVSRWGESGVFARSNR